MLMLLISWFVCLLLLLLFLISLTHTTNFSPVLKKPNESNNSPPPAPCAHCSARLYASRLMLQGAGLRRRQVTRISIKGIIDVGTAVSEENNTFARRLGGPKKKKKAKRGSAAGARKAKLGVFFHVSATFSSAVGVADTQVCHVPTSNTRWEKEKKCIAGLASTSKAI